MKIFDKSSGLSVATCGDPTSIGACGDPMGVGASGSVDESETTDKSTATKSTDINHLK